MRLPDIKFDQTFSWIAPLTFGHRQTDKHDNRDVLLIYNIRDQ